LEHKPTLFRSEPEVLLTQKELSRFWKETDLTDLMTALTTKGNLNIRVPSRNISKSIAEYQREKPVRKNRQTNTNVKHKENDFDALDLNLGTLKPMKCDQAALLSKANTAVRYATVRSQTLP
jgi:hypothetical protein